MTSVKAARARFRRGHRRMRLLAALAVGVLGACDSDPSGPGAFLARASAPGLGAVVLEVEGQGITGFAGRGSTRVYSAAVPSRPRVHRVVLVDAVGGEIGFDIQVEDVGMERPVVTVVQAAGTDNRSLSSGAVSIAVEQ
jgi:hypothetical protein